MIGILVFVLCVLGAYTQSESEVLVVIGGWIFPDGEISTVDVITENLEVVHGALPDVSFPDDSWTASTTEDEVVVCVGYDSQKECNHLNLTSKLWTKTSQLVDARYVAASVVHDNSMFIFGGLINGDSLSTVERYSTATNTWSSVPEWGMPEPVRNFCVVENNDYIYLVGGVSTSASDVMRRLSTASNSWETMPSMSIPRYGHACAVTTIRGEEGILVTGGNTAPASTTASTAFYSFQNEKWQDMADLNIGRIYHGMGILKNQPVVFGGYNQRGVYSSLEVYHETDDKWEVLDDTSLSESKAEFAYTKAKMIM